MAGLFSALTHQVKSAALEATGLENISDLIKQNPNDIHMILNFLIVLAYPSDGDKTSPEAQKRDNYMNQLKNQNNAQMVIDSILKHLNTILSITVDTPSSGYASSILDSVSFTPINQAPTNAKNGTKPADTNNDKRIAILSGLSIIFGLIDKKKLDYLAAYSTNISTSVKETVSHIGELLNSSQTPSIKSKADQNTKLIENILNTVNYDLGFIQSKVINESDIRSFTNISEFAEFLNTQKKAAQELLGIIQKAGPLRKIFTNMTDDNTSSDDKNTLIKHYDESFNSVVDWLTQYIEGQAPYIAKIVEGSKAQATAATASGASPSVTGKPGPITPNPNPVVAPNPMMTQGMMGQGMGMPGMTTNPMMAPGMMGANPMMTNPMMTNPMMTNPMMRTNLMMPQGMEMQGMMGVNPMMRANPMMANPMMPQRTIYGGGKRTLKNKKKNSKKIKHYTLKKKMKKMKNNNKNRNKKVSNKKK